MVDIGAQPMRTMHDGAMISEIPGGGVEVDFEPDGEEEPGSNPDEHDANLAEHMSEGELSQIALQIEQWVEADTEARLSWHDRLAEGLELLGVVPQKDGNGAFKLVNRVTHPMIAEAVVQFQARAIAELIHRAGRRRRWCSARRRPSSRNRPIGSRTSSTTS
jgi:hypothetical protein